MSIKSPKNRFSNILGRRISGEVHLFTVLVASPATNLILRWELNKTGKLSSNILIVCRLLLKHGPFVPSSYVT